MSIRNRLANPLRRIFSAAPQRVDNPTLHGREYNLPTGTMGIYDPPEPNISVLPPDAKQAYEDAYAQAMASYGDKSIAESTAWRKVKLSWAPGANDLWQRCNGDTCTPWPADMKMPLPTEGKTVGLGVLIEYGYIGRDGVLRVWATDKDHPPILWWDDVRKMLYAFPGIPYPACMRVNPQGDAAASEIYERWTKRKPECGITEMKIPVKKIHCYGAADTVSYRSDKWKQKMDDPRAIGAQEYIHKHWHEVHTWLDNEKDPKIIMIEGGELDVHPKGIIH